ncbi:MULTISPECIES: hypothetical protein [Campylobacter]|uniref:hypothetical protein n=1 Tax=Campylobacter TaxID=194 RepID=UPI0009C271A9|nr:hypothetical protein [Campylobacter helveticus]ARE80618.1 hypothetical protein CHELV3228_1028 [Campylobacter helveticus]MCR2060675.1 hypothetical protein [Campylobacter helveticus]MCR2066919.1 hypothetical protein [Campylobacter helveticus]MDL0100940.1 hypothetical protein [Campylobacter felis]
MRRKNSKIILVDTLEAEMIADLAFKANDIFLKLKKSAGVTIDYDSIDETLKLWNLIMVKTSQSLEKIANKLDMEYVEPSSITILKKSEEN